VAASPTGEIVGRLIAVLPAVGITRVVSAEPKLDRFDRSGN
jgi:hypothetical protein